MDYEKKYKEALGWMQSVYPTMTGSVKEDAEHYFPELRESEDERIRKELLNAFQESEDSLYMVLTPQRRKSFIAWLEKQGTSYTKKDIDDAYIEGMAFAKNELEKQKPAWSEEDERIYVSILNDLRQKVIPDEEDIDWFKSLKERYTWKPSNELMHYLNWIANVKLGDSVVEQEVSKHLNELYNDLKKL